MPSLCSGGERRGFSELVDTKEGGFRNWGKIAAKQQLD